MDDLNRKFADLDIWVSQGEDGRLTVSSSSEPLFCFVRDTEDEINEVVRQTLVSYVQNFHAVPDVEVTITTVDVRAAIPRISLKPVSQLLPNFASLLNPGRQLADAGC